MSFSALVVVGDGRGVVGFGTGKAKEVPAAIKKGIEAAKKNLSRVRCWSTTIQHVVLGQVRRGSRSAEAGADGTGVIAGGPVRAVVQAARYPERLDEIYRFAQSA